MSEKNIYQRLNDVMKAVSYIRKDQKKIDSKYTAVKHDDVCKKTRPALVENGVAVITDVISHSIIKEWDKKSWTKTGKEFLAHYTLTAADVLVKFVNIDDPNDFVAVNAFGYGIDNQDKGPGKAVSYAVKYAILKTLYLETGDDLDNHQGDDMNVLPPPKPKPVDPRLKELRKECTALFQNLLPEHQESIKKKAGKSASVMNVTELENLKLAINEAIDIQNSEDEAFFDAK